MKCQSLFGSVLVANILLASTPILLLAHHSASSYDRDKGLTLKGTVTAFLFINPHTQIRFEVQEEDGTIVEWIAESAPPQRLSRYGWRADSLKPGDHITVTGFPRKDGRKEINIRRLVAPSGQILSEGAE